MSSEGDGEGGGLGSGTLLCLRVEAEQRAASRTAEGLGEDGSVVAVPDGRVDDSVARLEQRGPVTLREVGVRVRVRFRAYGYG